MAQHSSIGLFASAVRGPLAGLALGGTIAVIGLLAGGGPSLSTAMESIRLRPSAGVMTTLEVDLDRARRANEAGRRLRCPDLWRAGIGKSRIAQAVAELISAEPHTRLRYFCSPHHHDSE